MIYHIMCGHMHVYRERRKCGYGRMVKFLFAKEKMRVRSPLSAPSKVMYYDMRFGIVDRDNVVVLSFFPPIPKSP